MTASGHTTIYVALPAFGGQNASATSMSLFTLGAFLAMKGISCAGGTLSHPDIADARNMFLTMWYYLHPQSTHILFVDADMHFPPELVGDMVNFNKPLVGCVYRKKIDDLSWVGESVPSQEITVENGFVEMNRIGMGVTLISRGCVDEMIAKYPELIFDVPSTDDMAVYSMGLRKVMRFFDKIPQGYLNLSEDNSFSDRYRAAGGKVYANVVHKVGHIGQKEYSGRLVDHVQRAA